MCFILILLDLCERGFRVDSASQLGNVYNVHQFSLYSNKGQGDTSPLTSLIK